MEGNTQFPPLDSPAYNKALRKFRMSSGSFIITYLLLLGIPFSFFVFLIVLGAQSKAFNVSMLLFFFAIIIGAVIYIIFFHPFLRKQKSSRPEVKPYPVTPEQQPELWATVNRLATSIGLSFQGKITLSPDHDAYMQDHNRFLKRSQPTEWTLNLGIGLFYSLSTTELEAVITHELAHYGQARNQPHHILRGIHRYLRRALQRNSSLDQVGEEVFVSGGASLIYYGGHAFYLVILKLVQAWFEWIHVSFLGLLRVKEVHADQVSARVCGSNQLKAALLKLEISTRYEHEFLVEMEIPQIGNRRPENFFDAFKSFLLKKYPLDDLPIINEMPEASMLDIEQIRIEPKVVFGTEWESHPRYRQRIDLLATLGNTTENSRLVSTALLHNLPQVEAELTRIRYEQKQFTSEEIRVIPTEEFKLLLHDWVDRTTIPKRYHGFYEQRLNYLEFENILSRKKAQGESTTAKPEFSRDWILLAREITRIATDLESLELIKAKQINVRTFLYDWNSMHRREAKRLIPELELDLKQKNDRFNVILEDLFFYYYNQAGNISRQIQETYVETYRNFVTLQHFVLKYSDAFSEFSRYRLMFLSEPESLGSSKKNGYGATFIQMSELTKKFLIELAQWSTGKDLRFAGINSDMVSTLNERPHVMPHWTPQKEIIDGQHQQYLYILRFIHKYLKVGRRNLIRLQEEIEMGRISEVFNTHASAPTPSYSAPQTPSIAPTDPYLNWVADLELTAHPEGGYYKETYSATHEVPAAGLPERFTASRKLATSIYFLLPSNQVSKFHRLKADEIWYYHYGSPLTVHAIDIEGNYHQFLLGPDRSKGQTFQCTIPAGWIFGSTVDEDASFSLVGCMVSPGFDFQDFELFNYEILVQAYPQHEEVIRRLT